MTPLRRHYLPLKKQYPNVIELFTRSDVSVPYHAVDSYVSKFIQAGHKASIVELLETRWRFGNLFRAATQP